MRNMVCLVLLGEVLPLKQLSKGVARRMIWLSKGETEDARTLL